MSFKKNKTTIIQINSVVSKGSTGHIANNIGKKIIEKGWTSIIVYGRGAARGTESSLYSVSNKYTSCLTALEVRFLDNEGLTKMTERNTVKLISFLKKKRPSVVHLHNMHGYYINVKILFEYLSLANIPTVWTLHDCWSFTGHCAHFEEIECEKWKKLCFSCPQYQEYPKSWCVDRSQKNFLEKKKLFTSVKKITIVPVSHWLKNHVKSSFLKKYPVEVIYNGVDLSVFKIHRSNVLKTTKSIVLGVTGIWTRKKGLFDLIELSAKLSSNYQVVLVGLTERQKEKLPSNIIGITSTNSIEELAQYYSQAVVYVNPTYEDTFPTTNLESLACGTPVITYNTGGSPEAIDTETGYVVEKGDIDGLVKKIELISQKGKSFYQEKCRARAEKFYNKDDRFADYIELYKEILKNK